MSALNDARAKRKAGAKKRSAPPPPNPSKAVSKFRVGDRVSPTDRENVGTVTEVLPGDRYEVHFVGEDGKEADVTFHGSDLRPWPPPADGGSPVGGAVVVPDYRPFPVHCLPPAVKEFVASVAATVGCDPCFAALPALALVGAAVGGALVVRPKRSWNEVPILWAVVVGDSGTAKSPAADPCRPLPIASRTRSKTNSPVPWRSTGKRWPRSRNGTTAVRARMRPPDRRPRCGNTSPPTT